MQIGIAITTVPKRADIHSIQMQHFERYAPKDAFIYVHNDWQGNGIAKSKNACISALMKAGCTHLFLFDDDCYPIKHDWHLPFIMTGINHLQLTYGNWSDGTTQIKKLRTHNGIDYFGNANGIMLYYTRQCIEQIGGMDIRYPVWGYEHNGLSYRIKNAGLTNATFMTPSGVMQYFYSEDYERKNNSLFTADEKKQLANQGLTIIRQEQTSKDWKPYEISDYVLTAYYTSQGDIQRNWQRYPVDTKLLKPLINSAPCPVICLTDISRPKAPEFKYVLSKPIPNILIHNYRFIEYYRWIKRNIEYCNIVYLLDATDTEFIGKKHKIQRGKVYINIEPQRNDVWLRKYSQGFTQQQIESITDQTKPFWNCGVIYGYAEDVMKLLEAMQPHLNTKKFVDMATINLICNTGIKGIEFVPVKSGFKSDDKTNVYIRHK